MNICPNQVHLNFSLVATTDPIRTFGIHLFLEQQIDVVDPEWGELLVRTLEIKQQTAERDKNRPARTESVNWVHNPALGSELTWYP